MEINPRMDAAYVELGAIYLDQRSFTKAEGSYKKALEINPGNDVACSGLGFLYFKQNVLGNRSANFLENFISNFQILKIKLYAGAF